MHYKGELEFFELVMKELHVQTLRLPLNGAPVDYPDFGLRAVLGQRGSYERSLDRLGRIVEKNTIHKMNDGFDCNYVFLLLPETEEPTVLLVGPYTHFQSSRESLRKKADELKLTPEQYRRFESCLANVPVIAESVHLAAMLTALGTRLWGSGDAFEMVDVDLEPYGSRIGEREADEKDGNFEEISLRMKLLEARYAHENELMELVSRGRGQKAGLMLRNFSLLALEDRAPEPMRNAKYYAVVLNTLLRKAAEQGGVHPLHIDRLSAELARKIERVGKWEEFLDLLQLMVQEYCGLVKKHATAKYSTLVQKVVDLVDFDLTRDLSLRAHAGLLNVSASYLSTIFKKETGLTLTEFVNRRRVEHASYLLRSTKQSVSAIAQDCGFHDDNYFMKLYKKYTGKTPRQFRDEYQSRLGQTLP